MLKIAIVASPVSSFRSSPCPNLGPAILKTFLDSNGYKTDFIDLSVRVNYLNRFLLRKIFNLELFQNKEKIINFLEKGRDIAMKREVEKFIALGNLTNYDVIGFTLYSVDNIIFSLSIAKILKEKYHKKIVFGGPITSRTDYSGLLDFGFVDFLVVGDGEEPFLEILRYFDGQVHIKKIDGIVYKKNGKVHKSRPALFPIERKPIPSFNQKDLKLYNKLRLAKISMLPYLLTRGCRFKCAFCCEYEKPGFSYMPLEKVISDIRTLLDTYQANSIFFAEANLDNDSDYLRNLSERIISEKLQFFWGGQSTISGLDEKLIRLMAKAGCRYLLVGLETASESVRKRMNMHKIGDLKKFKANLKLLKQYGIRIYTGYIVEFPYETDKEFKENVDFLRSSKNYITTAFGETFFLIENSSIFFTPRIFNLQIREKSHGKYSFFNRGCEFDEVNGLNWETKKRQGEVKKKFINKTIFRQTRLRFIVNSIINHPSYALRLLLFRQYSTFDEYLL